jgi:hypothetical protein
MLVSPELDHFFLAGRHAGDGWPSGDRAIELAGRWQQYPASNQRRYGEYRIDHYEPSKKQTWQICKRNDVHNIVS